MPDPRPSLVLVDDDQALLDKLVGEMEARLADLQAEVRPWSPTENEKPLEKLEALVDQSTVLVVTDYDLTAGGRTGLFGPTVVGWSQQRALPVGDFSRMTVNALPKEPNFFELRVPTENTAAFIEQAFRGFHAIRQAIMGNAAAYLPLRSPASVLATLLGRPEIESQLALYSPTFGPTSGALLQRVQATASDAIEPSDNDKLSLIAYVAGHVLLNAVLKYPGPILHRDALCAYVATDRSGFDRVADVFRDARYEGPFSGSGAFFWRDKVDDRLEHLSEGLEDEAETIGALNRAIIERAIGEPLPRHGCKRCDGDNGGFYCPFTDRAVCTRSDCSISSSSWVPDGARVCRVESGFYEEWAPLLGL